MGSCLLPVLKSALSVGCVGLTCSFPLKHHPITGTNHNFWELYALPGPASENGDSDAALRVQAHETPSAYSTNSLLTLNVLLLLESSVSWCGDQESVGAVSRLFLGLSLHGLVLKNKQGTAQVFKRAVGREEREKRIHPSWACIMYKGKLSKPRKDLAGLDKILSETHSPNSACPLETQLTV